jgi:hypothetical protein
MKKLINDKIKATWVIRYFGLSKVPLIFYCRPSVIKLTEETTVIKIPFKRSAGGILAMDLIHKSGRNISLVFKDFKADFLKRPEGNTYFTCNDGLAVKNLIDETTKTGERVNMPLKITATVPEISGNEPVAEFVLTLSLKDKSKN